MVVVLYMCMGGACTYVCTSTQAYDMCVHVYVHVYGMCMYMYIYTCTGHVHVCVHMHWPCMCTRVGEMNITCVQHVCTYSTLQIQGIKRFACQTRLLQTQNACKRCAKRVYYKRKTRVNAALNACKRSAKRV